MGLKVGEHDPALPLVIDPVLVYSTLLGGSYAEYGADIAVDASGNAIVVGRTDSISDFPIVNAAQPLCAPSPNYSSSGCTA